MNDNSQPALTPNRIEDRARKPLGVIPKHLQSFVIIGVAVAMILIMWVTGGSKKAAVPRPMTPPPPPVSPTDAAKVQSFKSDIQSEQQAARRAVVSEMAQADALGAPRISGSNTNPTQPWRQQTASAPDPSAAGAPPIPGYQSGYPAPPASAPAQDSLKADKKKREYLSLFASNVALTYRKGDDAQKLMGTGTETENPGSSQPAPSLQSPATDYLSQLQALGPVQQGPIPSTTTRMFTPEQEQGSDAAAERQKSRLSKESREPSVKPVSSDSVEPGAFNKSAGKTYVLFEGTVIETALMNRLDGSFAGPVNCLVTNDVYSHDRQHVLIPAGSKVLGDADKVNTFGQQRLAVAFHRLIMPDGYSVSLDQFKGLDQIGATALRDKVNNHYLKIFGASLAVGILGGIAQAGSGDVLTASAWDRAQAGFGSSMALAGMQILDRFLNILPTITIREGDRVKVYLSNDLLLPDYSQHDMDPDL